MEQQTSNRNDDDDDETMIISEARATQDLPENFHHMFCIEQETLNDNDNVLMIIELIRILL